MSASVRLALPIELWPERDRVTWQRATAPANSLFGPGSAAARFSPSTIKAREEALANWFGFLHSRGELDPQSAVGLVTPERLDLYFAEQRRRSNANSTIAHRLAGLHAALRLIAPGRDFKFILRPGGQPLSLALPYVPRQVTLHSDKELIDFALELFRKGLIGESYANGRTAIRDAALIGILATRAPRKRSLSGVELGRQLQKRNEVYWLSFSPTDMKGGQQPLSYPLPAMLTPILDTYIAQVRPAFGGNETPHLWVGTRNRALSAAALYKIVVRRMRARFGQAHGLHWFRKCLTTIAALKAPEAVLDVCTMLGHTPAVSLRHYNKATNYLAAPRHDARISRLQEQTQAMARQAFRRST